MQTEDLELGFGPAALGMAFVGALGDAGVELPPQLSHHHTCASLPVTFNGTKLVPSGGEAARRLPASLIELSWVPQGRCTGRT